jgi:hypothetical protein
MPMNITSLPNVAPHSRSFCFLAGTGLFPARILGAIFITAVLFGQDANDLKKVPSPKDQSAVSSPAGNKADPAIALARERAKLLHDVYSTTLDVMHHRYFRRDGAVLPARAMEDVFEQMAELSGDKANWISVNTKAMSINHEPATGFEKKAAAELSAGKEEFELVENGIYQRAAAIPLGSSCVGCHTKMFSGAPKSPRFAGLVISIPLKVEKK